MSLGRRRSVALVALACACSAGTDEGPGGSPTNATTGTTSTSDAPTTSSTTSSATDESSARSSDPTATTDDNGGPVIPCPQVHPGAVYDYDDDGMIDVLVDSPEELAGLAGCTDVFGSLRIRDDAIVDLSPLASLRRVHGAFDLHGDSDWSGHPVGVLSLAGLQSLEYVRDIRITATRLTDLAGLEGLTEIPGDVEISQHWQLESLEALRNLRTVGGALEIHECPALADLDGLRGLEAVGVRLFLGELPISSLHGLEALTEIGSPGGESRLTLYYLGELTALDALAGVEWRPEHEVWIAGAPITDLQLFAGVEALTSLDLTDNWKLTGLAGLESLGVVHDALTLCRNNDLESLDALVGLHSVGSLSIESSAITDLGPLPSLTGIDALRLTRNPALASLSRLVGVTSIGALALEFNPALTGLPELAALAQVDGDLELRSNDGVTSLADLSALTSVGGRLAVVYNAEILQAEAEAWGAAIEVGEGRKIVANKGYDAPLLDPCPWANDGECDAKICAPATDGVDCLSD
ncbi:MAG: hypothetical protein R3B09_34445 [Nannocystaceae bacterium]